MKFSILMQDFIQFLDKKNFNYNMHKIQLYNRKKEKNEPLFSGNYKNYQLDNVFKKIYFDFNEAYNELYKLKLEKNNIFDIYFKSINSIHDIPKSEYLFDSNYIPEKIKYTINNETNNYISFKFKIKDRTIRVIFVVFDDNIIFNIEKYEKYMDKIYVWFYIASKHAYKYCSKNLDIYIYMTNNKREMPKSNIHILEPEHINGGVSNVCVKDSLSELVIFRKEEWFKVLIHETFHNYGLDFSDLMIDALRKDFKKLFPIQSKMEIFESYTEFWAEFINICFICYETVAQAKSNKEEKFMQLVRELINIERSFSLFQCNKTLSFMNLEYEDLFRNNKISAIKRNNFYKEKTNVFPYYIIKTILFYFCEEFLIWNNNNNTSLLRFNKTTNNLHSFFTFVEDKHNNDLLLQDMKKMNIYLKNISKTNKYKFYSTMRMSICEFL